MLQMGYAGLEGGIERSLFQGRTASSALVLSWVFSFGNPFPAPVWGWAGKGAIRVTDFLLLFGRVSVLRCDLCHLFLGFVFLARVVNVSGEDFDAGPDALQFFERLGGAVAGLGHLIDFRALLLCQSSQCRMLAEVFRRTMVVLRILSRDFPYPVFPHHGQHAERAAKQAAVTSFPFPLLGRQVPPVFILTPSVAFQPEAVETRAGDDDCIPLLGGPLFRRLEQLFATVVLARRERSH